MTYHIILLVIISNDILLNSLIALIYYFILNSLLFQYTKSYLSIARNWFFFIILLKNIPVCYLTTIFISICQYLLY